MPGESPLDMMRPRQAAPPRRPSGERRPSRQRPAGLPRRWRLWPLLLSLPIIVLLGFGWTWLWYHAAAIAGRTVDGWLQREVAAGRVYSCATQSIGGFPFRVDVSCAGPSAEIKNTQPPYAVAAKNILFAAEIYHPTSLTADVTGPLTVAIPGQGSQFVAQWSQALLTVGGLPPDPSRLSVLLHGPQVAATRARPGSQALLFKASEATLDARLRSGSPRSNPVIEVTLKLGQATAPELHSLFTQPANVEVDAVVRGLKDLSPKPWAQHLRELQAAGGGIEIKEVRIDQEDAVIVGTGNLSINAHGKLDGLVHVSIAGIEQIVPRLGLDQAIARGIERIAGSSGNAAQGLSALDRLVPGLGSAIRQSANANLIDNLKRMGQPTQIDGRPAIVLPLRIADGSAYLGILPLGEVPPLF